MMAKNVATTILQQLSAWGVKQVYGFIGDDVFFLFDAIAHQEDIKLYQVRHEETAALMASAQAKLTGELGVCIADGGPGFFHLLNGLADAYTDGVPVLSITGQVSRKDVGTNAKQYIQQQVVTSAFTGYSDLLADPQATVKVLNKAYRTAMTKKTVAHITVPMDIFAMPCDLQTHPYAPYLTINPTSSQEVINGAVEKINQAQRPLILVGEGGRNNGELLAEIALKCGAGIITTLAGMGAVSSNHPYYVGGLGHAGSPASTTLLNEADLCIVVGANWWPTSYVPKNIATIEIDIRPANIGSSSPYAYGLLGDAQFILSKLLAGLKEKTNNEWQNFVKQESANWRTKQEQEAVDKGSQVHPATVIKALEKVVSDKAIICLDTGDNTVWFGRIFNPAFQRILISGKWRTMGFGLPAALAAKINSPDRQVVAVVGDGGFSMTMADFITAVKYDLPLVIIILNNHSLAMEKNKMEAGGLESKGTALINPDFAAYARSCGGEGITVNKPEELEAAFREAFGKRKPVLIDVLTAALPVPGTKLPS